MKKRVHIIFNPVAGAGKATKLKNWLIAQLEARCGDSYAWMETKCQGDAIQLSGKSVANGATLVIAVGGDGTINEAVNGFFQNGNQLRPSCELGILNCGSGGGFAQSLGLPGNFSDQLDLIFQKEGKPVDTGKVTWTDEQGQPHERYFVSECQAGISADIVSKVGLKQKRFGGAIAFGSVALAEIFRCKAVQMKTSLDRQPLESEKLLGVAIGNGRYCAGGMQLTPGASLADGLLDVLCIQKMSLPQRLLNFGKVYSGKHIFSKYCSLDRVRTVEIVSIPPVWVETDGELLGMTPCKIEVLPGAIKVKF